MTKIDNINPVSEYILNSKVKKSQEIDRQDDKTPQASSNVQVSSSYKSSIVSNSVSDVNYMVNSLNARLRSLEYAIVSLQESEQRKKMLEQTQQNIEQIAELVSAQIKMNSSSALMAQANLKLKRVLQLID